MNSKFNKSMLWVVMLSAVSQAFPMGGHISRSLVRKARNGAANIVPDLYKAGANLTQKVVSNSGVAGAATAAGTALATEVGSQLSETTAEAQSTVATDVAAIAMEALKNELASKDAQIAAKEAALLQAQSDFDKAVATKVAAELEALKAEKSGLEKAAKGLADKTATYYDLASEKYKNNEAILKKIGKGCIGLVTVGSAAYLVYKSGYVKPAYNFMKKHYYITTGGALALGAAGFAAYRYAPEITTSVASKAGNLVVNPYVASGLAAAAIGKRTGYNKSGLVAGATLGLAGTPLGQKAVTMAKNGVVKGAQLAKDYAVLAKDLANEYVVSPVVSYALKNPVKAVLGTAAALGGTYGLYKGVQYLRKPAKQNKQAVPAPRRNNNKQGRIAALQNQVAQLTDAVTTFVSKPFVGPKAPAPVNNQPAQNQRRAAPVVLNAKSNGWMNPMKDMLSLVDQAVKGDKKALATAKDLAKGNPALVAHIDTMMKGSFAKLARLQARGQACEKKQMNAAYTQVEAAHKAIAQICNLQYQRPTF